MTQENLHVGQLVKIKAERAYKKPKQLGSGKGYILPPYAMILEIFLGDWKHPYNKKKVYKNIQIVKLKWFAYSLPEYNCECPSTYEEFRNHYETMMPLKNFSDFNNYIEAFKARNKKLYKPTRV